VGSEGTIIVLLSSGRSLQQVLNCIVFMGYGHYAQSQPHYNGKKMCLLWPFWWTRIKNPNFPSIWVYFLRI